MRLGKILGKKTDGQRVEVTERLAGKIPVQENDVAPILLGHVAITGNEAVYAAVVAVCDDTTFDLGVVCEAITEAQAIAGGERRLGIFHARDGFGFEKLLFIGGAAAKEKLHESGEFAGRSF